MDAIVAVYDDWGIGCEGTQPIALQADRRFFRQTTKGAMVIAGRKTVEDFPGCQPLPGRVNVILTRSKVSFPGFITVSSPEEAAALAKGAEKAFVLGGGSVYRQMLPYCDRAYVTKVHTTTPCDTYFPDLDRDPDWERSQVLLSGQEDGIGYEMCLYVRRGAGG